MSNHFLALIIVAGVAVGIVGCSGDGPPRQAPSVDQAKPAKVGEKGDKSDPNWGKAPPTVAEKQAAKAEAAMQHRSCAGSIDAQGAGVEVKKIQAGDTVWEVRGPQMRAVSGGPDAELRIGVVADIKEATPENLDNLKKLAAQFKARGVNLVVVVGDIGDGDHDIANALVALAASGAPTGAVIGNRESVDSFDKGLELAMAKSPLVFSLNTVRRVDTAVADLISLPGYYSPEYLHSDGGCLYDEGDLRDIAVLNNQADSPVVLVSHGGPLQTGDEAIDLSAQQQHTGDPALARVLSQLSIPFGIFANIHEAGGRATDLNGTVVLAQKSASKALYLNPGPADAVRWVMNDGTESTGMGALLSVSGGKASYEILRLAAIPNKAQ